jgi:dTDP-4-dehydrorhamnose 3,5-epimerase
LKFIKQWIPEVFLIEPNVFSDDRGCFFESFRQDVFNIEVGRQINFVQDNESKSSRGVLRGLHFQLPPFAQSKLVRVIEGSVLDVALDIRKSSPTYGKHVSVQLSAENKKQLFIPRGFAHGFVVLSKTCTFVYKVDNYYSQKLERGVIYNDADLGIDWKISPDECVLSAKDLELPKLNKLITPF